jgi:hypothetical protein
VNGTGTQCDASGNLQLCASGIVFSTKRCPQGCQAVGNGEDFCPPCNGAVSGAGCDSSGNLVNCQVGAASTSQSCPLGCQVNDPQQIASGPASCKDSIFCAALPNGTGSVCNSSQPGILETCNSGVLNFAQNCTGACQSVGNGLDFCAPCSMPNGTGTVCDGKGNLTTCLQGAIVYSSRCPNGCQQGGAGNDQCSSAVDCSKLANGFYCESNLTSLTECLSGAAAFTQTCANGCQPAPGGNSLCFQGTPTACTSRADGFDCDPSTSSLLQCNQGNVLKSTLCPFGCQANGHGLDVCSCGFVSPGQSICGHDIQGHATNPDDLYLCSSQNIDLGVGSNLVNDFQVLDHCSTPCVLGECSP